MITAAAVLGGWLPSGVRKLTVKIDRNRATKSWWVWDSDVPELMGYKKKQRELLTHIRNVSRQLLMQSTRNFRREPDDQYMVVVVREPFDDGGPVRRVAKFSVSAKPA